MEFVSSVRQFFGIEFHCKLKLQILYKYLAKQKKIEFLLFAKNFVRHFQSNSDNSQIPDKKDSSKSNFRLLIDSKTFFSPQIFFDKTAVETAVRSFLVNGYFLGFIEVAKDETFKFSDTTTQASQQQTQNCLDPRAANKSSRCPKKWFEKCSKNPLRCPFGNISGNEIGGNAK